MRRLILIGFVLISQIAWAQVNLVPNPSFEEYLSCPDNTGQIWKAEPWYSVYGGCDYFHECGSISFGVPNSYSGGGYARTGQAYGQVTNWILELPNEREYIGVELKDKLIANNRYDVVFYISMWDSLHFAVKNIGIHFSKTPHSQNITSLLNLQPQVEYSGSNFLTEKETWIKIEGSFIADGEEKYIAIGNFDNDAKTDTVFVPDGGGYTIQPQGYWDAAAYFIDDVSVTLDTTYIGIAEQTKIKHKLYPNPNDGNMYLEYLGLSGEGSFELYDITGRRVNNYQLRGGEGKLNITEQHLDAGIYVYRVLDKDKVLYTGKVIIQH